MKPTIRYFLLLVFLAAPAIHSLGQQDDRQKEIDSLTSMIEQSKGIKKADCLVLLGKEYIEDDSGLYFKYINQAGEIYKKQNYYPGLVKVIWQKGYYYSNWIDFEKAASYYHKAAEIAKEKNLKYWLGKVWYWLAVDYNRAALYDSAIIYFKKSYGIYSELNDITGQGMALQGLGSVSFNTGNYYRAIDYFNQSIKLFKEADTLFQVGRSWYLSALSYYKLGRYDSTVKQLFRTLKVFKKINFTSDIWNTYDVLGNTFYKLGKYDEALFYYKAGLKVKDSFSNARPYVPGRLPQAYSYNNMARVYNETGKYDTALIFAKKSLEIKLNEGSVNDLGNSYDYLGRIYKNLNNLDTAVYFSDTALLLFEQVKNKTGQVQVLLNLGEISEIKGDNEKAAVYYLRALKTAEKTGALDFAKKSTEKLSRLYEKKNDFQKAFEFYKLRTDYKDSIFNKQSQNIIFELQTRFKTLEKEKEIQLQKKMLLTKKMQFNYLIYGGSALVILLILVMILVYKTRKQKEKLLQQENENLQKELELKNRDLVCNVSKIYSKNQVINKVAHTLMKSTDNFKKANADLIKDIIGELKQNLNETSWMEFETRFAKVHGSFYETLDKKFPDLTKSERKLCAMLKLGMSSKEIAAITLTSSKSVDTFRSRLRKKLNLNPEDNLYDFLNKL